MSAKMKSVLVFKTTVINREQVGLLTASLDQLINKNGRWNFDLEDCDNIFRVETDQPDVFSIEMFFKRHGFLCEELQ